MGRRTVEMEESGVEGGTPSSVGLWSPRPSVRWTWHCLRMRGEHRETKEREQRGGGRAGAVPQGQQRPMASSIKQATPAAISEQRCNPGQELTIILKSQFPHS